MRFCVLKSKVGGSHLRLFCCLLLAVAQIAANDAKLRVAAGGASATDRGQLPGSIRAEPGSQPLTANVVADVDYAVDPEIGTSTVAPRPFMRPAVNEAARLALAIIAASIQNAART